MLPLEGPVTVTEKLGVGSWHHLNVCTVHARCPLLPLHLKYRLQWDLLHHKTTK